MHPIKSPEGQRILLAYVEDLLNPEYRMYQLMTPDTPFHSPEGSVIGDAKKKHDESLNQLQDFTERKFELLTSHIMINYFEYEQYRRDHCLSQELNTIIDTLEEQWGQPINAQLKLYLRFYATPDNSQNCCQCIISRQWWVIIRRNSTSNNNIGWSPDSGGYLFEFPERSKETPAKPFPWDSMQVL